MMMGYMGAFFNSLISQIGYYSVKIIMSTSMLLGKLFSEKKNKLSSTRGIQQKNEINDVLFFSAKECGMKNLDKMIKYLESAEKSLDICVYTITYHQFALPILQKFKEGKKVRILTDLSMSYGNGSQIPMFRKHGVLVRGRSGTSFLMHHKFAIVDNQLLINGSLNWTAQGVSGNEENVTITSNPALVQKYQQWFNGQWEELNF